MSWPSATDPFYLANTADNNARRTYYNVNATPSMFCDGAAVANWATIQTTMQSRMGVPSPLWMDLVASVNGTTLNVTARCVANTAIGAGHVIQMMLLDRYTNLPASPNGQPHHYHSLLKIAPTASGQAFTANPGDTVQYSTTFTLSPSWSVANLDITAFVQNNSSKEILQSRCEQVPLNMPNLNYQSNLITDPNLNHRAEPGETCQMAVTLSNGQYYQTATNVVGTLSTTDPSITITTNSANYPNIDPGGSGTSLTPYVFSVNANAQPHVATMHLHVVANPFQTVMDTDFQLYVDFQSSLLIDDDGGSNFQNWYKMDLDSLGASYEYWDVNALGEVTSAWLNNFNNAIWFTSNLTAPLSVGEQTTVTSYLNQGGHLFLVGEELDEQFRGTSFYTNTLHCTSQQAAGYFQLTGTYGDPISNGTTLLLVGGSGAGNSYSPNAILPGAGATTIYTYDNSAMTGAIRWSSGNQKLVYMAFNFEAVSGVASTTMRRIVLNNILNWFAGIAPPAALDVNMVPIGAPIVVPAIGGSFSFNASLTRVTGPAAPYVVWIRAKNPNGTYTAPLLGPVTINTPVGITVTRNRNQNIPSTWASGLYTYLGYVNSSFAYPAMDSSSFTFTKSALAGNGPYVWDANCYGELFPGEVAVSSPMAFNLVGASPNPFNPTATISFTLPEASRVTLNVFDVSGRQVAQLVNGLRAAGVHQVTFDGSNLTSGVYLYTLTAGSQTATGKLVLLK
jgi:hypothetical protein